MVYFHRWADSISIHSIALIATDSEAYKKRYSATQQDNVSICFWFDWKLLFMLQNLMKMNFDKFSNHQASGSIFSLSICLPLSTSILHTAYRMNSIHKFQFGGGFVFSRFIHEPRNKLAFFIINTVSNRIYVPCLMFIWSQISDMWDEKS